VHAQRLVSVVNEEQCYVEHFLWAKGLKAKDIHKEMFLDMVESVCHVKWFITG
jgi:hypothetical protein